MEIGEKLKQLRVKMCLTQEELADRCELSKGFISQVERDLASPSIATLKDILDCLGTNLKDFFNDRLDDKVVFCKEDVFEKTDPDLNYDMKWLIPISLKYKMEPILLDLGGHGRTSTNPPYEGEMFGYVIKGSVFLCLGGQKHKVKKGEGFYCKPDFPYYIENITDREATVLCVSTPPNF